MKDRMLLLEGMILGSIDGDADVIPLMPSVVKRHYKLAKRDWARNKRAVVNYVETVLKESIPKKRKRDDLADTRLMIQYWCDVGARKRPRKI